MVSQLLEDPSEPLRRVLRRERFGAPVPDECEDAAADDVCSGSTQGKPVVGRNHALFRPFVRLRSAPDPAVVRPEHLLRASLSALLDEDARPEGGWQAIREQLWSIRQDLLVQHLHRGSLAADVSLQGARLAIEHGDVTELHRSLAALVANGPCAKRVRQQWAEAEQDEIYGYRLMYLTHGGVEGRPGRLENELCEFLQEHAPSRCSRSPAMACARKIHQARTRGLWARHMRLIADDSALASRSSSSSSAATRNCRRLARVLAPAVREGGLAAMVQAFPHGISAVRAASLLGFTSAADLSAWLKETLQLGRIGSVGRPLGKAGQLDTSVVAEYLERQRVAKLKALQSVDTPTWALEREQCKVPEVQWATVLERVAADVKNKKLLKKVKKKVKKAAKKKDRKEKKRLKKQKKLVKQAKKDLGKASQQAVVGSSSSSSSSSFLMYGKG